MLSLVEITAFRLESKSCKGFFSKTNFLEFRIYEAILKDKSIMIYYEVLKLTEILGIYLWYKLLQASDEFVNRFLPHLLLQNCFCLGTDFNLWNRKRMISNVLTIFFVNPFCKILYWKSKKGNLTLVLRYEKNWLLKLMPL